MRWKEWKQDMGPVKSVSDETISFPHRCEPMTYAPQASAAVALIALSLWLQSGGMAALIGWARTSLGPDTHKLEPLRAAVLMVRFTTAIIALHVLQILLWASFYRWLCLPLWESAFYFSTASYTTVGSRDVVLPHVADPRSGGKCRWRLDVRAVRKLPVCHGDQACTGRGAILKSGREAAYRA